MPTLYLGLGSNIPPRFQWIGISLDRLLKEGLVQAPEFSRAYISSPWGMAMGDPYINLVLKAETPLEPESLIKGLKDLEHRVGRRGHKQGAPREIDLDILFYGDALIETPYLRIPHPKIPERRFVLAPLADLSPGMIHPELGRSVLSLLSSCPDSGLVLPVFCPISSRLTESMGDG